MSEIEWDDDDPRELGPLPYLATVIDAELWPDDVAAWACSVPPARRSSQHSALSIRARFPTPD